MVLLHLPPLGVRQSPITGPAPAVLYRISLDDGGRHQYQPTTIHINASRPTATVWGGGGEEDGDGINAPELVYDMDNYDAASIFQDDISDWAYIHFWEDGEENYYPSLILGYVEVGGEVEAV